MFCAGIFDINTADPDDPEMLAELAYAKRLAAEHGAETMVLRNRLGLGNRSF